MEDRPGDDARRDARPVGRIGQTVAGRYRLDEQRPADLPGAERWDATDSILARRVTITLITGPRTGAAVDGARRAALVVDPRLARILDVGTADGTGYVVTEAAEGRTLASLVATAPLAPDQARAVVGEAAGALEAARRRGVHHLALRPSAIRVTPAGRVLIDGLAVDGELLGTTGGGAHATSRTDTVGLVRLLYTALTGRWPIALGAETTAADVPSFAEWSAPRPTTPAAGPLADLDTGLPLAPEADGAPVPPTELVPGLPADLDTLCAVTLGPHDDGPHSPGELVRELEPWRAVRADAIFQAADAGRWSPVGGAGTAAGAGGAAAFGAVSGARASGSDAFGSDPAEASAAGAGTGAPGAAVPGAAAAASGAGAAGVGAGVGAAGGAAAVAGASLVAGAGAAAAAGAAVPVAAAGAASAGSTIATGASAAAGLAADAATPPTRPTRPAPPNRTPIAARTAPAGTPRVEPTAPSPVEPTAPSPVEPTAPGPVLPTAPVPTAPEASPSAATAPRPIGPGTATTPVAVTPTAEAAPATTPTATATAQPVPTTTAPTAASEASPRQAAEADPDAVDAPPIVAPTTGAHPGVDAPAPAAATTGSTSEPAATHPRTGPVQPEPTRSEPPQTEPASADIPHAAPAPSTDPTAPSTGSDPMTDDPRSTPTPDDENSPDAAASTPVARQSVRSAFGQDAGPGSRRPGTPPPATPTPASFPPAAASTTPVRTSTRAQPTVPPTVPPTIPPASAAPAAATPVPPTTPVPSSPQQTAAPAVPPTVPPTTGAPAQQPAPWELPFDGESERTKGGQRRLDPTRWVLGLVAVAVVVGVVIALGNVLAPWRDSASDTATSPAPVATQPAGEQTEAAPGGEAPAATAPPQIAAVNSVDPSDGDGEHEELVGRLTDGDPATAWYTHTYNRPDFAGFKDGVGLVITLAEPATVTSITLDVNGSGGNVEVRSTDAANPTTGDVLASGPLNGQTVLTLSQPTQTQSIVLWFNSLSQTSDGANRIEISNLAVS